MAAMKSSLMAPVASAAMDRRGTRRAKETAEMSEAKPERPYFAAP